MPMGPAAAWNRCGRHRGLRSRRFKAKGEFIGKSIGVAGEHLTGTQMAAKLSRALGREARYSDVPADVYRSFGFPGADDMGNMSSSSVTSTRISSARAPSNSRAA